MLISDMNEDFEYIESIIKSAVKLPDRIQKIGACEVQWWEGKPGDAIVMASGGTVVDRTFAESVIADQLKPFGYKRATFKFAQPEEEPVLEEGQEVEGDVITGRPEQEEEPQGRRIDQSVDRAKDLWNNLAEKAIRLIQSGSVVVTTNRPSTTTGTVRGDHGVYKIEIGREGSGSNVLTSWTCECPWDQYAWQRTRQWKKYEGRPCSHVLALFWQAEATPIDKTEEDPGLMRKRIPKDQLGKPSPAPSAPPAPQLFGPASEFAEGPGTETGQVPTEIKGPRGLYQMRPPEPPEKTLVQNQYLEDRGITPAEDQAYFNPEPDAKNQYNIIPESPVQRQQRIEQQREYMREHFSDPRKALPNPTNPLQQMQVFTKKSFDFNIGDMVQLIESVVGLTEGPEGASGVGVYKEAPVLSQAEVCSYDEGLGLAECLISLDDNLSIRCFTEPKNISAIYQNGEDLWEDV